MKNEDHRPGGRSRSWAYALLLALLVALPYLRGLQHEFVWLDQREIVEEALTISSLGDVPRLFIDDDNFAGYHRPIYNLMHSLDRWVWGLDPFGFYLSSLLLHSLTAVLLFAVLRGLAFGPRAAFAAAALFGLHPVVSSVAGLVHSKADLLVTTFLLLMILGIQRLRASGPLTSGAWSLLAAAGLALALFTKELGFLAPIALVFWLPQIRSWARERSALVTAFALYSVAAAGLVVFWRLGRGAGSYESDLSLEERLLTFMTVYVDYARKIVFPHDPSICDSVTVFSAMAVTERLLWASAFTALVGAQWLAVRHHRWSAKWLVLYNLALVPVAQIIPILHFRADRFLYIPVLCVACLLVDAARRIERTRLRPLTAAALAALTLAAGVQTARRVECFANNEALFTAEIERTPDYLEGLSVLARHHDQLGEYRRAKPLWDRALASYPGRQSFIDLDATLISSSHNSLALGDVDEAYEQLSVRLDEMGPGLKDHARYNLAVAAWRLGKYEEAHRQFETYGRAYPGHASCQFLLGRACLVLGRYAEGLEALGHYLELVPDAADRPQVEEW
ncbi:MAG: tetratricopeptide repeat protein, partial [Planctomycetota bacterium]